MAEGEWIIFMNSGDVFVDHDVFRKKVFSYPIGKRWFIYSHYYVGKSLVPASSMKVCCCIKLIIYKKGIR